MTTFQIGVCRMTDFGVGGGTKRAITLAAHLAQRFAVTFITTEQANYHDLQQYFGIDLSPVNLVVLRPVAANVQRYGSRLTGWYQRLYKFMHLRHDIQQIRALHLDLFIDCVYGSNLPPLAPRSIYMCMFPHPRTGGGIRRQTENIVQKICLGYSKAESIAAYDVITANSQFTQHWIQQSWARSSTLVYSACELIEGTQPKAKIICHVGRFVADRGVTTPTKRQDLLIDTFKTLTDLQQSGWELHLAGGLAPTPHNQQYLEELKRAAAGYPIIFHVNARFAELHDLYRRASLYWHATGYGVNATRYPITQEHLGMTTVEAMSAGAVPIVINSGGQAEIVTHGVNGFVWQQPAELCAYTRRLANEPAQWEAMRAQAVVTSRQFSKTVFLHKMDAIVDELLLGATSQAE